MTGLQPFVNDEFELDLIPHGDSFRVAAAGLAKCLGFRDAYILSKNIPDAEKGYVLERTPGGEQRVLFLTEAGFYRALGQRQAARIPDAAVRASVERFQSWVYGEVLPSLRRNAAYSLAPVTVHVEATINQLALVAYREYVVSAAASIMAHRRWDNDPAGARVFVQLTLDLGLPVIGDGAPVVRALPKRNTKGVAR